MGRVNAVICDLPTCATMAAPAEGAELPTGWLLTDIYIEGEGNLEARTLCSWACLSIFANNRIQKPQVQKRKRRTRAEIEADEAAAKAAVSAQPA